MKHEWHLSGQPVLGATLDLEIAEVHVEYDGPEVMTVVDRRTGVRFLAVAMDEPNEDTVRYVQAPIHDVEGLALFNGEADLRDILWKPGLAVVDWTRGEKPSCLWEIPEAEIPHVPLPPDGVPLPTRYVASPPPMPDEAVLLIDGPDGRTHRIELGAFGAMATQLQGLWAAIAGAARSDSKVAQDAAILIGRWDPGSVKVQVYPRNPATFPEIAAQYAAMVRAKTDQSEDAAVERRFGRYLSVLAAYDITVYARWNGKDTKGVLLSSAMARRFTRFRLSKPSLPKVQHSPVVRGTFDGYRRKGRHFWFQSDEGHEYEGEIDASIPASALPPAIEIKRYEIRLSYLAPATATQGWLKCKVIELKQL